MSVASLELPVRGIGNVLADHLRNHAASYLPEADPSSVSVRMVRGERRPVSALYEFEIESAEACLSLLVKVPGGSEYPATATGALERPRLVDQPDAMRSCHLERLALASIQEHFTRLGDTRFGAIRVFDLQPEGALVMERLHQPSLRSLLMDRARWRGASPDARLDAAFHHAGAWLRSFHGMPAPEHAATRHASREELIDIIGRMADYVAPHTGEPAVYRRLFSLLNGPLEALLPGSLPLGVSHGDFALRNVLVGPRAEVTVCDTRARWRTAVYEDIGIFLVALRCSWPQLFSLGAAFDGEMLFRYENRFLAGYFDGEEVPREAVRVYELLALLDRLAGVAARGSSPSSRKSALRRRCELMLLFREVRKRLDRFGASGGLRVDGWVR